MAIRGTEVGNLDLILGLRQTTEIYIDVRMMIRREGFIPRRQIICSCE